MHWKRKRFLAGISAAAVLVSAMPANVYAQTGNEADTFQNVQEGETVQVQDEQDKAQLMDEEFEEEISAADEEQDVLSEKIQQEERDIFSEEIVQEEQNMDAEQPQEQGAGDDEEPVPVMKVTFDDGTANDITGNNNNGTIYGTPEFIKGKSGKAIHIENPVEIAGQNKKAEQYVDFGMPEDLQFGTEDFSIAFWYKSDRSADTHKEGSIISNKDWDSGNNQGLNFGDMNQGLNMNYRAGGTGRKETDRYAEITDGQWHFITGTFDRDGEMILYIDGELPVRGNNYGAQSPKVDISDQQNSIDVADFVLGADGTGDYGLQDGYIDELSVYKQVLTQDQIKEIGKAEEEPPLEEPLVLDVNFDDETAQDSVAGNNGVIQGDIEFVEGISGKAVHISNPEAIAGENKKAEQYIDFGQPENLKFGAEDYTIMFWYQSDGNLPKEGAVVSNKDWSSGGNEGFAIGDMRNGMTLNFRAVGGSGRIDTSRYAGATEKDTWHHIAAVFNRTGNMTLFVDGQEAEKASISSQNGKTIDVTDFVLGADGKYQCAVQDSYIDELKVYKKALSQEEILDYNAPYILQNMLNEYEQLLETSQASDEKKEKFRKVIDEVRAQAEGVTEVEEIQALENQLKAAYNEFIGPDNGIMSFEVISDTHIPGTDNSNQTNQKLIDAMDDIKDDYSQKVSAVLNAGDFSADGSENQEKGYFDIIGNYQDEFSILTAMGNHDVRWKSGWDEVEERYLKYNQQYMGDTPQGQSYYDQWIDGYHFVVLNTQWDTKDRAYLSPEELQWLDETLSEDASPDKPVFIVLHQALYDTYTNSNAWAVGAQDHELKQILRKYPQSFIFTGHIHDGLGAIEVQRTDFGTVVDVPGMKDNDYGDGRGQLGFHVTVYEDSVRLDLRDYKNDEWVSEYSYTFDMNQEAYPKGEILNVSFDDGTAQDSTGNGNHGTVTGNVEFVKGVNGGKGVHIQNESEDTESYIDFGNQLNLGTDDFTVMFWYKANEGKRDKGTILANTDGENTGFAVENAKNQKELSLAAAFGREDATQILQTDIADGRWHAVTATFDRDGDMNLYYDGVKAGSQDISTWKEVSLDSENMRLVLGADETLENGAEDIYIDNLSIYRNVVGEGEISTTWNPYQATADEDCATVSWNLDELGNLEPAFLLLNGEKMTDIASGAVSSSIEGLAPGETYTVQLVNREKSHRGNYRDVYSFNVTTAADCSELQRLYEQYSRMDVTGYTQESRALWKKALDYAKSVLDLEAPLQEDVEQAIAELQAAKEQLETAEEAFQKMTVEVYAESLSYDSVKVTWKEIDGADGYYVYYAESGVTGWRRKADIESGKDSTFTMNGLKTGTEYLFTVKAYKKTDDGVIYTQYKTDIKAIPSLEKTKVTASYAGDTNVQIRWEEVSGANGYWVYRKAVKAGSKWERIGVTAKTSYKDTKAVYTESYYYTAKAYRKVNNTAEFGTYPTDVVCKAALAAPEVTAEYTGGTSVQISWKQVSGASGYWVYRKAVKPGSRWERIGVTAKTSYKDVKAAYGETYYYTAKAYTKVNNTAEFGTYPEDVTCKVMLAAPDVTVSSTRKGTVDVKWSKIEGADGYLVYRNRGEKGSRWERITPSAVSASTFTCTDKVLESGHTYYFTVKAICMENGKTLNGDYLKNVSITVK